jgi:GT2 family glycosyltransferase
LNEHRQWCLMNLYIKNHINSIDVSLCIVNWNTKSLTSQLIESIYKTTKTLRIEIFVVDNASTDGSTEQISNEYPEVKIIQNNINVGYGAALNQALIMSGGRYKMILNSDILFIDESLEIMVSFLDNNQDVGAVGPICLDKEGNIEYSGGYFPRPGRMILERILGSMTPNFIKPPPLQIKPHVHDSGQVEVEYIMGACMLIRAEVCDEIGLFDQEFFAYYEETDWCFRMMKRGVKRHLISNAKVIHYHDASFSQVPEKKNNYFEDSKIKYLEKHYGKAIAKAYICANAWADIRHKIKRILLSVN